jgi:hypothetical protein
MAQPVLHSDALELNRAVGGTILYQNAIPYMTNTQIAAASGVADLKNNVRDAAVHADQEGLKPSIRRALDIGKDDTSLSDTNVQAASTAATLAANTYVGANDIGPPDLL